MTLPKPSLFGYLVLIISIVIIGLAYYFFPHKTQVNIVGAPDLPAATSDLVRSSDPFDSQPNPEPKPNLAENDHYYSSQFGFDLKIPRGWSVSQSGGTFTISKPEPESYGYTITIYDQTKPTSLDAFRNALQLRQLNKVKPESIVNDNSRLIQTYTDSKNIVSLTYDTARFKVFSTAATDGQTLVSEAQTSLNQVVKDLGASLNLHPAQFYGFLQEVNTDKSPATITLAEAKPESNIALSDSAYCQANPCPAPKSLFKKSDPISIRTITVSPNVVFQWLVEEAGQATIQTGNLSEFDKSVLIPNNNIRGSLFGIYLKDQQALGLEEIID